MKGWIDQLENGGNKSREYMLNMLRELPTTATKYIQDTGQDSDKTKKILIGEDKPNLKFMRNATITEKALSEIKKLSSKYPNVNPNEIAAAMAIENAGQMDAGHYQNTHMLYDKIQKDLGIPDIRMSKKQFEQHKGRMVDPILFTDTEQFEPIKDSIEYTNLAKELGVFQPNGEINEKALLTKFNKEIPPKIQKYKEEFNSSHSYLEDLFKYYDRYGIEAVNPGQKVGTRNPNNDLLFKQDYPTMVKNAAEYIQKKNLFDWKPLTEVNSEGFKNIKSSRNTEEFYNGGELNYNESSVSIPPNFVGMGNNTQGRNYSPAWEGQFEDGGALQKIAGFHPVVAGAKKLMSNFAENVPPYGYEDPLEKVLENGILNIKHHIRSNEEKNIQGQHSIDAQSTRERIDLLKMLANEKQKYNSIPLAEYRPQTEENQSTQYYKSPSTEEELQKYIDQNWIKKHISSKEDLPERKISKTLGHVKFDYGKDKQGSYISYYDKWDLNPIPRSGINWLDKIVDKVVTGVPNALGITNTPEVYGRVYLPKQEDGGEIAKDGEEVNIAKQDNTSIVIPHSRQLNNSEESIPLSNINQNIVATKNWFKRKVAGNNPVKDTSMDISDSKLKLYQSGDKKPDNAKSVLFNEFVENNPNTVRYKKDFINSNDSLLGDKEIPLSKIKNFYGVEDGKFKVGSLNDFSDSTKLVPIRSKDLTIDSVAYTPSPAHKDTRDEVMDIRKLHKTLNQKIEKEHPNSLIPNPYYKKANWFEKMTMPEKIVSKDTLQKYYPEEANKIFKNYENRTEDFRYFNDGKEIPSNEINKVVRMGKFLLNSPETNNTNFISSSSDSSTYKYINDFLKNNKTARPILVDNGRYRGYEYNDSTGIDNPIDKYNRGDFKRDNQNIYYQEFDNENNLNEDPFDKYFGANNNQKLAKNIKSNKKKNGGELKKLDDLVNFTNYNKYR